jgi:hypothetical protein
MERQIREAFGLYSIDYEVSIFWSLPKTLNLDKIISKLLELLSKLKSNPRDQIVMQNSSDIQQNSYQCKNHGSHFTEHTPRPMKSAILVFLRQISDGVKIL